jgi:hypothetical protein
MTLCDKLFLSFSYKQLVTVNEPDYDTNEKLVLRIKAISGTNQNRADPTKLSKSLPGTKANSSPVVPIHFNRILSVASTH